MTGMISIFLNLPRLDLWPRMWSILEKVPCALVYSNLKWRRKWQPTQVFLPGESQWTGAWQATVHGVERVGHNLAITPPPPIKKCRIYDVLFKSGFLKLPPESICLLILFTAHNLFDSQVWQATQVKWLSRVRLFMTPWTVAYRAPLSMEFSRKEYWSGLPFSRTPYCLSHQGSPSKTSN